MMKKYYAFVRSLHLYIGLFLTPFVLIFSISVLLFNHPDFVQLLGPIKPSTEMRMKLDKIPYDSTDLLTAKAIIEKLEIEGEIDFINQNDDRISFPVKKPGFKTQITVNKHTDSVLITQQNEGPYRALTFLHSMPGPHNVKIRGNSNYIQVWRVLADVIVYLLLFLTISGVFLWYFLKVERNLGFFSIALGLIIFTCLLLIIF